MRGLGLDLWDEDSQQLVQSRVPAWGPQVDGAPSWGSEEKVHALSGFHECRRALSDPLLESKIDNQNLKQSDSNLLFLEGEEHARLRGVIGRALPSWRLTAASTGRFIEHLVEAMPDHARIDLVSGFAEPIAEHTSRTMLGLPTGTEGDEGDQLAPLLSAMSAQFDPGSDAEALVSGMKAGHELLSHFRLAIRKKSYTHGSALDLLNQARLAGELSIREMLASLVMLAHASFQNTANLLSFAAVESMTNARAYAALTSEDTASHRRCVEELLRLGSPARFLIRRAAVARALGDVSIAEGDIVIPCVGLANRDSAVFARPDELELDRDNNLVHLAFGAGPHACLGAALARAETLAAVCALTARYRTLKIESVTWGSNAVMHGPLSLMVELTV